MLTTTYLLAGLAALSTAVSGAALDTRHYDTRFAMCRRVYAHGIDYVEVYGRNWGADPDRFTEVTSGLISHKPSSNTFHQLHGCGPQQHNKVMGPSIVTDNSHGVHNGTKFLSEWGVRFTIAHRGKFNCMGRAVKTAGGPDMTCQSALTDTGAASDEVRMESGEW